MSVVSSLDDMMRRYANRRAQMLKQMADDEDEIKRIDAKSAEVGSTVAKLDALSLVSVPPKPTGSDTDGSGFMTVGLGRHTVAD
jgi:hypothetical protein